MLIAAQNNQFRQTLETGPIPGSAMLTAGISRLEEAQRHAIVQAVMTFDVFSENNDPYGEHDFGSIDYQNVDRIFWKIDYYEPSLQYGSEDSVSNRRRLIH